jgi:hypothetical protein
MCFSTNVLASVIKGQESARSHKSEYPEDSFYRHQKTPLKTSSNKIEAWIEKENRKKDNSVVISGSSNIILDDSDENNDNNLASNTE